MENTNVIKCIAVDDEPLALAQIKSYIQKIPYLNLIATCRDAFEAMDIMNKETIDLMFIDINMPDLNGLEFVKSLSNRPYIVFTTAYSEYAIDGFKVEAVDYLLKPFSQTDLLSAADKVKRRIEVTTQSTNTATDDFIFVKSDFHTNKIRIDDIIYIEGMSEYVKIYTESNPKPLMPLLSMRKLEEALPSNKFMRIHRSYIVNLDKITDISCQRIVFGNTFIPIGDNYKDRFNDYINSRIMK